MNNEQPVTQIEGQQPSAETSQPQPWHRPTLKRLRLSLDTTVAKSGSAADGISGATPPN